MFIDMNESLTLRHPTKASKTRRTSFVALIFIVLSCACTFFGRTSFLDRSTQSSHAGKRLQESTQLLNGELPAYDQKGIESLAYNLRTSWPLLFVFDGHHFKAYLLGHWKMSFRYVKLIPLLVHALRTYHPERFQPGQPVFQMVFCVSDYLMTDCANDPDLCPVNKFFPPIVSFSSVFRDDL